MDLSYALWCCKQIYLWWIKTKMGLNWNRWKILLINCVNICSYVNKMKNLLTFILIFLTFNLLFFWKKFNTFINTIHILVIMIKSFSLSMNCGTE